MSSKDRKEVNSKKYVVVFFITAAVFTAVFFLSNYLYGERINQVKNIEDNIGRNILESEVQYALLSDAACETSEDSNPAMISEINALSNRLSYMEEQRGADDAEVVTLKKYYSLLQIKDYLLLRERSKQCGQKPSTILYFYTNVGSCDDCKKQGYALTSMREDYDQLHIYAFDYNLGLSVIETLKSIYKLNGSKLPILVINRKPYYGFMSRGEIEQLMPELAVTHATSTKATTTHTTTGF